MKARGTCGHLGLPMPKTLSAVHQLLDLFKKEAAAGRMGQASSVWLGCHWSEPAQRWEWDDHTAVGLHLLENFFTKSHDYEPRLRPFMVMKQTSWRDAHADEPNVIMCEESSEDIQLV